MRNKGYLILNEEDQILALCGSAIPEWADHQLSSMIVKHPGVAIRKVTAITEERPHTGQYIKDIKNIVISEGRG